MKNKEEKGDLEKKAYTPYLGLLIFLSPFLNLAWSFQGPQLNRDLGRSSP